VANFPPAPGFDPAQVGDLGRYGPGRRRPFVHAIAAFCLLAGAGGARAQAIDGGPIQFDPAASRQSCQIFLLGGGAIRASLDNMELSSMVSGGQAAQAQIVATNSSYRISVDEPSGFSMAPAGGNDAAGFKSFYRGSGATDFSMTPGGIPVKMKKGTTSVEIDFLAASNGNGFPAGDYQAELTLRCE
jgi:hypothetical protein